jgi:hypothetical protein
VEGTAMSVFGIIKCDEKVFVADKIRLDARESFIAPGLTYATLSHEISVDAGVTWYNISDKKYVDWLFSTAGTKTISLRLSTTEPASYTFTKDVVVLDVVTQKLFSNDSDLYKYETEIDQYLPKKWSSWNMIHLAAQEWIMDWLDEKRITDINGDKYVVDDIMDAQQVKQLSCYKALEFIYESNINIPDDLYTKKRDKYRTLANEKASKAQLSLDFNKDTLTDSGERTDLFSISVRRG